MNKEKFQERLGLITEAAEKIKHLKDACVFTTDLRALEMLQRTVHELQEIIGENLKLSKELRMCRSFQQRKKKR